MPAMPLRQSKVGCRLPDENPGSSHPSLHQSRARQVRAFGLEFRLRVRLSATTDSDVVEKDLSKAGRGGLSEVLELEVTVR
jgi:hypothetical protein